MRRALGARRKDIRRQFLLEAALLSSIGGVIGVLLGALIAMAVRQVFPAQVQAVLHLPRRRRGDGHRRAGGMDPVDPGEQAAAGRGAALRVDGLSLFSHLRRGFGENVRFAMMAVRAHKLRASLTVLGIVVGRRDRDRDGLDRDRLRQQHGPQLPGLRRDARAVPEVLDALRPRPPLRPRAQPQGPDARGRPGAEGADPGDPRRLARSGTCSTARRRRSSTATRSPTAPTVAGVYPDYSLANNHFVDHGRFFTDSDIAHGPRSRSSATDVPEGALPPREPAQQDRRAATAGSTS